AIAAANAAAVAAGLAPTGGSGAGATPIIVAFRAAEGCGRGGTLGGTAGGEIAPVVVGGDVAVAAVAAGGIRGAGPLPSAGDGLCATGAGGPLTPAPGGEAPASGETPSGSVLSSFPAGRAPAPGG